MNNKFSFEEVDFNKFRCIKLAYEAGKKGGTFPVALNVANDLSVDLFLRDKINFIDIERVIEDCLNSHSSVSDPTLEDINYAVKNTENFVKKYKF